MAQEMNKYRIEPAELWWFVPRSAAKETIAAVEEGLAEAKERGVIAYRRIEHDDSVDGALRAVDELGEVADPDVLIVPRRFQRPLARRYPRSAPVDIESLLEDLIGEYMYIPGFGRWSFGRKGNGPLGDWNEGPLGFWNQMYGCADSTLAKLFEDMPRPGSGGGIDPITTGILVGIGVGVLVNGISKVIEVASAETGKYAQDLAKEGMSKIQGVINFEKAQQKERQPKSEPLKEKKKGGGAELGDGGLMGDFQRWVLKFGEYLKMKETWEDIVRGVWRPENREEVVAFNDWLRRNEMTGNFPQEEKPLPEEMDTPYGMLFWLYTVTKNWDPKALRSRSAIPKILARRIVDIDYELRVGRVALVYSKAGTSKVDLLLIRS